MPLGLLNAFSECAAAFVLHIVEILPLLLHVFVGFKLHVGFCPFVATLVEGRNQVDEEQRIHALALIFRLYGNEQQVDDILFLFDAFQQVVPTKWQHAATALNQRFGKRWHRHAHTHKLVVGISHERNVVEWQERQIFLDVVLHLLF